MIPLEEQVRSIFLVALDRAPDQWRAFLDENCGSNLELRARVEQLLEAHQALGSIHVRRASGPDDTVEERVVEEAPGTQIGPYELLEPLGEGGMGTVWAAQQTAPVKRLVAVKLIKAGMDSKQVIARFEAERQALALMDHANIARVLDAGTTDAGRPFFVMDLVKGVPITRFCDERRLTIPQRLELFVPVCHALQHAHQKGIIHRDLKPSNVLVTLDDGRPVPKVIDFGVAKATGQPLTEKTLVTGIGSIVGTLEYMAPEQTEFAQVDFDTRSDVYSLGVLLHELLAGSPPFTRKELERAGVLEMLRVIREQEPTRPSVKLASAQDLLGLAASRGTEPARLTRLVRGELDWIVMKALEKERDRRYETANAFALDVQRYLANEPVLACPPSATYRVRKFARRHRAAVLAACLVLVTLLLGVVSTAAALVRANRERDQKQQAIEELSQEQKKVEAALEARTRAMQQAMDALRSLSDQFIAKRLTRQAAISAEDREFLKKIVAQYEAFASVQGEGEASQAIRAEGYHRLAALQIHLADFESAIESGRLALDMYRELAAQHPGVRTYRERLAACHVQLGRREFQRGNSSLGEAGYREAIALLRQVVRDFGNQAENRVRLSNIHNDFSGILEAQRKWQEASAELEKAMEIDRQLGAEFPAAPEYRRRLMASHGHLATVFLQARERAQAEPHLREAIALGMQLVRDHPGQPDYRHGLAAAHEKFAMVLAEANRWREAEPEFRKALRLHEQLVAEFPLHPDHLRQLAQSHAVLGNQMLRLRMLPDAEGEYREALVHIKKLASDFPGVINHRIELAMTYDALGRVLAATGRWDDSESEFRQAISIHEPLARAHPNEVNVALMWSQSCHSFGHLFRDSARPQEALVWYQKAIQIVRPFADRPQPVVSMRERLRQYGLSLALLLASMDRHAEAVKEWDRVIELERGQGRPFLRMKRATSLARLAPARAVAEVDEVTRDTSITPSVLFGAACACSQASAREQDAAAREQYAARAVRLLHDLRERKGLSNPRQVQNLEHLELAPLRSRADFKKLLVLVGGKGKG